MRDCTRCSHYTVCGRDDLRSDQNLVCPYYELPLGEPLTCGTDYEIAKKLNLTNKDRWGEGIAHHPKSERLMAFLKEHDFEDYGDYFCWKVGGDGDNGEILMYQMDAFFEMIDSNQFRI